MSKPPRIRRPRLSSETAEAILRRFVEADRPLVVYRTFVDLGVGVNGALMLSQALYWSTRTSYEDGWFHKSRDEWRYELGLTKYEQLTARRNLREIGVWEEFREGIPPKSFYRVNKENLLERLDELFRKRHENPEEESPFAAYADSKYRELLENRPKNVIQGNFTKKPKIRLKKE